MYILAQTLWWSVLHVGTLSQSTWHSCTCDLRLSLTSMWSMPLPPFAPTLVMYPLVLSLLALNADLRLCGGSVASFKLPLFCIGIGLQLTVSVSALVMVSCRSPMSMVLSLLYFAIMLLSLSRSCWWCWSLSLILPPVTTLYSAMIMVDCPPPVWTRMAWNLPSGVSCFCSHSACPCSAVSSYTIAVCSVNLIS